MAWRQLRRPTALQLVVRLAGLGEDRWVVCRGLIAAHDYIDVEWIEFDATADAASPVCGDEGRTGTEERVKDDVIAFGDVEDGVLEHGGRLDGRMVLETAACVGAERRGAGIGPEVRAPAAAFAEFDVVDVRRGPLLEQRQKLMLRAIEAAHASVGLRPDNEIQGDEVEFRRRQMNGRQAPPVDERAEDAAVAKAGEGRLPSTRH